MNITKNNSMVFKKFANDYRLPLVSTCVFLAVVIFLIIGRLHDRTIIGQILTIKSSGGDSYANLLSQEKADNYNKNAATEDENISGGSNTVVVTNASPKDSQSSAVISQAPSTQVNVSAVPGSVNLPGGTSTTIPPPNPPPAVFTAYVTEFKLANDPTVQCTSGSLIKLNLSKCSKKYSFLARFQTLNGPGTVSYDWVYSVNGSTNGTVAVSKGAVITTLTNELTLSCLAPGPFTAKFSLSQPSVSESQTLAINHTCV